jgi:hypothetical protein
MSGYFHRFGFIDSCGRHTVVTWFSVAIDHIENEKDRYWIGPAIGRDTF